MRNFCELGVSGPGTFHEIFLLSLRSFFGDLCATPWFLRERELVSAFVFGHLVPKFQESDLDIRQISIECPVRKTAYAVPEAKPRKEKPGATKDLVIWPHANATVWSGCKPLAIVEWTYDYWLSSTRAGRLRNFEWDQKWLRADTPKATTLGYALFVRRLRETALLKCVNFEGGDRQSELVLNAPEGDYPLVVKPAANLGKKYYRAILESSPTCTSCTS